MNFIQVHQTRINQFLQKQLDINCPDDSKLKQAMAYSLLSGGKRIRPLLVYATAHAIKVDIKIADYLAAAIEMIHAYSLIHDDLPAMDDDDLRRGLPTNHIKFDEATAILAGDALQSMAFETLSNMPAQAESALKAIKQLAQASGASGMAGGQSLDLLAENSKIKLMQLQEIHAAKTGALLTVCVRMPAGMTSSNNPKISQNLINFANHLGVLFQIIDDILDITQDTETLGKPAHSDYKNHKSTYPSLLGLDKAQQKADEHINAAYENLNQIPLDTSHLKSMTDLILNRNY